MNMILMASPIDSTTVMFNPDSEAQTVTTNGSGYYSVTISHKGSLIYQVSAIGYFPVQNPYQQLAAPILKVLH